MYMMRHTHLNTYTVGCTHYNYIYCALILTMRMATHTSLALHCLYSHTAPAIDIGTVGCLSPNDCGGTCLRTFHSE